jgi:uncharacterized hydrophobic protein (TIGR00271 family)
LVSEADKSRAVEKLIKDSTPDFDFFYLIILSVLMATFGLLIDSVAVVIGSMLIDPMLYPVLSLSLGVVMSDYRLIRRSFYTIFKSSGFGIVAAIVATIFLSSPGLEDVGGEILARTNPSLLYFGVAVVAGLAVSYSLVKPGLNETFPGVAVSVALIPPLAVVGIGLAKVSWAIISGAFVLFVVNILGIIFAGMLSFSLMNLYVKRKVAAAAIREEDKRVEDEERSNVGS